MRDAHTQSSRTDSLPPCSPLISGISSRENYTPRAARLAWVASHDSGAQVLAEPCERLAPGGLGRRFVVSLAAVVVEGVVDVRIDDLAESLAALRHRRLDRRDVLVDAVVAPGIDGEHRRAYTRHLRIRNGD